MEAHINESFRAAILLVLIPLYRSRSSYRRCSVRKVFLKISQISQETLLLEPRFNEVAGLQLYEKKTPTLVFSCEICVIYKDTSREKSPSNKTAALTKSMNMGIWVVYTSNQLIIRSSQKETFKKWSSYRLSSVLCDRFIFCYPFNLSKHWLLSGQFYMELLRFQF